MDPEANAVSNDIDHRKSSPPVPSSKPAWATIPIQKTPQGNGRGEGVKCCRHIFIIELKVSSGEYNEMGKRTR